MVRRWHFAGVVALKNAALNDGRTSIASELAGLTNNQPAPSEALLYTSRYQIVQSVSILLGDKVISRAENALRNDLIWYITCKTAQLKNRARRER